ncbi:MAG: magnesium transporter [Deltaproteobacteria bacterium]|nr:magnesium transporter [Deltaproteobacteria bacterium]
MNRLFRRNAVQPLTNLLQKSHVADLGFLLPHFSETEQLGLVAHLKDEERRAQVLAEADKDVASRLLGVMPPEQAVELLQHMEPDDASDLLQLMDEEAAESLLQLMREGRDVVEELSQYDQETAGGIMSPRFFSLLGDTTAGEAIEELQRVHDDLEMVFYVYVVSELEQLLGVLSLRQLVTTKRDTKLIDLMTSDVVSVTPDVDQEEVAKIASRYGLLAVPVVDEANKLIGIITVDDVIDVLREEATEDILRMAGAGDDLAESDGLFRSMALRARWLFVVALGGAACAALLATYAVRIDAFIPVVFLVPLVLGLSGMIGLQGTTVVMQRLLQGRLGLKLASHVLRQGVAGMLLGVVFGLICAFLYWIWIANSGTPGSLDPLVASAALGLAVCGAMAISAMIGAVLPIVFSRVGIDPALSAGPLGTIVVDLLAMLAFLAIGSFWL